VIQQMPDISKWDRDDDPLTREQVVALYEILGGQISQDALEGFLVVSSRFVDEFGGHRTAELAKIFRTGSLDGQAVLRASLEYICRWVGGMTGYENRYPVTINPSRPAFPLFKIVGIDRLAPQLYRVLSSTATAVPTPEPVVAYVARTGRLPAVPRQRRPVRRSKPRFHWCSYEAWETPETTRVALQILPGWSDCRLRATLPTRSLRRSSYVAFSGDRSDPEDNRLRFYKYFYEPLAQDHSSLSGGGTQIAVDGSPPVDALEQWDDGANCWISVWRRTPKFTESGPG
jgi:hypothetical protein